MFVETFIKFYIFIKKDMETCGICKETFNNLKGLTTHVNAKHHLNGKEYYDNYLKKKR